VARCGVATGLVGDVRVRRPRYCDGRDTVRGMALETGCVRAAVRGASIADVTLELEWKRRG